METTPEKTGPIIGVGLPGRWPRQYAKATEAKLAAGPLDARGEMPASDGLGLGWNGPIRRGDNDGRGSAAVRVCSILKAVKSFESKSMLVRLSDLRPAVPWS